MRGYVIDAALLAALVLAYPAACWLRPFCRCWWCKGVGCRWCRSTGRRLRWGRRLYNAAQRARVAAERGQVS
jgi:hypothetical protein